MGNRSSTNTSTQSPKCQKRNLRHFFSWRHNDLGCTWRRRSSHARSSGQEGPPGLGTWGTWRSLNGVQPTIQSLPKLYTHYFKAHSTQFCNASFHSQSCTILNKQTKARCALDWQWNVDHCCWSAPSWIVQKNFVRLSMGKNILWLNWNYPLQEKLPTKRNHLCKEKSWMWCHLGVKVKEDTAARSHGSPSSPCSTSNLDYGDASDDDRWWWW